MARVVGRMGFHRPGPGRVRHPKGSMRPRRSPPTATSVHPRLLESAGYTKEVDYFTYKLDVLSQLPELHEKVCRRLADRGGYQVLEFRKRSELKPWVRPVLGLMNETFVALYGYAPMDDAELTSWRGVYLPIIDPRFRQRRDPGTARCSPSSSRCQRRTRASAVPAATSSRSGCS